MASSALPAERREAVAVLAGDVRRIFGERLRLLVAYGLNRSAEGEEPLHTMALVDRVTFDDLAACARVADGWWRMGLAVPLVMARDEFLRTLDVFPLEYDAIINDHVVIDGPDTLAAVRIPEADLRLEVEFLAKSHLIHLREGFLESGRESNALLRLISASAPAFRTLLASIARLDGHEVSSSDEISTAAERTIGIDASLVVEVLASPGAASTAVDPSALLARYLAATERVWQYVDAWRSA